MLYIFVFSNARSTFCAKKFEFEFPAIFVFRSFESLVAFFNIYPVEIYVDPIGYGKAISSAT